MGVLKADLSLSFHSRIGKLHLALCQLIETTKPTIGVIEKAFLGPNVQSALKLGEARGALVSALTRFELPIFEVAATQVKNHITGKGHASKAQVALALKALLGTDWGKIPYDATDALAIALTFGTGS
jgi:crossover junction endodeoxyribonuclease RuvC